MSGLLGSVVHGLSDAGGWAADRVKDGAKAVASVGEDGAKAAASGVEDAWKSAVNDAKALRKGASDLIHHGDLLDRGLGALQAGVGVIEVGVGVVGGVLTSETGVGAVAGGVVALHGLDDIQAGVRQAWTGKPTETVTQHVVTSAAQHAGAPPAVAAAIGIGVDMAAGGGVGGPEKAAVKGTEAAVKGTEAALKGTEAAAKGTEAAAKGTEAAAKGTEAVGKGGEDAAKVTKGEHGTTGAGATKGAMPEGVINNQAAQDDLIRNQQKQLREAIEQDGAKGKGKVLDEQGKEVQRLTGKTLEQVKGADVTSDARIGRGEGSEIDFVVGRGGKRVYVESKLTIAEPNNRMINQLTNATKAAKPGDTVILQVGREPTPGEIANLRRALGDDVFSKINIVTKQTDLFDRVTAALK